MIQGNEIFVIQKEVTKKLGGIFGPTKNQVTLIAVALDAAIAFGMLMHQRDEGTPEQIEAAFWEKYSRIVNKKL